MIKLTDKELRVLSCVQFRADAPVSKIARALGYREHAVRRILHGFLDRNLVSRHAIINLFPAGYTDYLLFFSFTSPQPQRRAAFVNDIVKNERVFRFAEIGGSYQYLAIIWAPSLPAVAQFIEDLSERHPGLLINRAIAGRIRTWIFGFPYQPSAKIPREHYAWGSERARYTIDETDHYILRAISQDSNRSHRELSRQIGIAETTLTYRLQRLRERGVIVAYDWRVNPAAVGLESFLLLITATQLNPRLERQLVDFCLNCRAAHFLVRCLGSWDYEAVLRTENGRTAAAVIHQMYEHCGGMLENIQVVNIFDYLKSADYPFLKKESRASAAALWGSEHLKNPPPEISPGSARNH